MVFVTYKNKRKDYMSHGSFRGSITDYILNPEKSTIPQFDYQMRDYITTKVNFSRAVEQIATRHLRDIELLNETMMDFITRNEFENNDNKQRHYTKFKIPKRKGGYRELINPSPELKALQRRVLDFLTDTLQILPHNAAHAFTKNRDMMTNAEVHKNSKYFLKMDLKDFFPSITTNLLREKLSNIHIFGLFPNEPVTTFLDNLIIIATLDDCLPQGSPLSPYLSNLVMLEFDYSIDSAIRRKELPYYWYTRYADDMTFSSKNYHNHHLLIDFITKTLYDIYGDAIKINTSKTKFLKNTGRLFITGVKLNKDNNLTIGHEKKKVLKHELFNLFIAEQNNELTKEQVQTTLGQISFMNRIEPGYTQYLIKKMLKKFNSRYYSLSEHFKRYL